MKEKSIFRRWWFWLIIVILLIAIFKSCGDDDVPNNQGNVGTSEEQTEGEPDKGEIIEENTDKEDVIEEVPKENPEVPELTVSAKEIIDAFEENELKGKQTYTGKRAEITGVVGDIGEILGSVYVTLGSGEDFEIIMLQCFFKDEDEMAKVAELKKGDTLTLIGTIGEQSMYIEVKDCKLK